jgi:cytochrome c biogenesis protein CcmG/thiol:disulfide interchange protein DsbE
VTGATKPNSLGLLRFAPVALFAIIGVLFAWHLWGGVSGELPSVRIDKPAPKFDLPTLQSALAEQSDGARLTTADLATGDVVLVNFWASWCVPCRVEHPKLMAIAASGDVQLFGIAYGDDPRKSQKFLDDLGDPFVQVAVDETRRIGLIWGLTGVPETFVLTADGRVAFKHVGPIQNDDLETKILPAIEAARRL